MTAAKHVPLSERILVGLWTTQLAGLVLVDCYQFLTFGTLHQAIYNWNWIFGIACWLSIKTFGPSCKLHELL